MTETVTVTAALLVGGTAVMIVLARRSPAVAGWGGAAVLPPLAPPAAPTPPAAPAAPAESGFALVHRLTEVEEAMDWLEAHGHPAPRLNVIGDDRFLVVWDT